MNGIPIRTDRAHDLVSGRPGVHAAAVVTVAVELEGPNGVVGKGAADPHAPVGQQRHARVLGVGAVPPAVR